MPTARFWLTVAVTNDSLLYAIGGGEDDFYGFSTVEVYDPLTNTWQSKTPVSTPRFGPVSIIIDDTIYAIGGFDLNTAFVPLDVVERYEESTNTWFNDTPVPTGRYLSAGARVLGKMYVIGGFTSYATGYSGVNEEGTVLIGVKEINCQVSNFKIQLQVYPNPFSQKTEIRIQMQDAGTQDILLKIYDVSGRMVKSFNLTSPASLREAGRAGILSLASAVSWSGTDQLDRPVPAGVYFVRLATQNQSMTEKVILLK